VKVRALRWLPGVTPSAPPVSDGKRKTAHDCADLPTGGACLAAELLNDARRQVQLANDNARAGETGRQEFIAHRAVNSPVRRWASDCQ
jgi:hypothetical protein